MAQWLAEEVGEGAVFTKQALRSALPNFEQVDRRMRDLRSYKWRIDTNREDPTLRPGELRVVSVGHQPGEPGFRPLSSNRVSAKERLGAISEADFRCQLCGVQLGEPDESESGFANLLVKRVDQRLLVACGLCASAAPARISSEAERLSSRVARLTPEETRELRDRTARGDRQSPLEAALAIAVHMPRDVVIDCADTYLSGATGRESDSNRRTDE
ncbi:hypothetical protein [Microbacterium sp. NPDC087592]|uniref:hypothetical protein n=1 Tax=Microbacterium sp. NPDC087592 TaxID=3364193 RepID=UPI00382BEFD4